MKSYLGRLVARVMPPAENLPAAPAPISDPFADAADAGEDSSTATRGAPNVPSQISRDNSPLPPPSGPAFPEPAVAEMGETGPPSSQLKDQTPLPTPSISLSKRPPEPLSTPHSRSDPD